MRTTLFIVVIILTIAAWLFTCSSTQNMGLLMEIGVPMSLGMEGSASLAGFVAFTAMWVVMSTHSHRKARPCGQVDLAYYRRGIPVVGAIVMIFPDVLHHLSSQVVF